MDGYTLYHAIKNKDFGVVREFLRNGVTPPTLEWSAYHLWCHPHPCHDNWEFDERTEPLCDRLLHMDSAVLVSNFVVMDYMIDCAIRYDHLDMVRYLVEIHEQHTEDICKSMSGASSGDRPSALTRVVRQVTQFGWMSAVARYASFKVADFLVHEYDYKGSSALSTAAASGNVEFMKWLLAKGFGNTSDCIRMAELSGDQATMAFSNRQFGRRGRAML
jgi:ankyrin repeat protein